MLGCKTEIVPPVPLLLMSILTTSTALYDTCGNNEDTGLMQMTDLMEKH